MDMILLIAVVGGTILIFRVILVIYRKINCAFKTRELGHLVEDVLCEDGCIEADKHLIRIETMCARYGISLKKVEYNNSLEHFRSEVLKSIRRAENRKKENSFQRINVLAR